MFSESPGLWNFEGSISGINATASSWRNTDQKIFGAKNFDGILKKSVFSELAFL